MAINPLLRQVPDALKKRPQWLVWRMEANEDPTKKPRKVPYYADGGRRFGVQGDDRDRSRLVTFGAAIHAMAQRQMTGIGFAFLPDDGLIGIDIDGAIDTETGEISERARSIIEACASYTELSPSKKGVHIYVEGRTKSFKSNDIGVEVFCSSQFFTVTGDVWPGAVREVAPIDAAVLRRLQLTVDEAKGKTRDHVRVGPAPMSDERTKIESALLFISPDCGYDEWIQVGMAIHAALGDGALGVWDYWSAKSAKYAGTKAIETHWKSFKPGGGISAATIYKFAHDAGWKAPRAPRQVAPQARDSSSSPVKAVPAPAVTDASTRSNADTREPFGGTEPVVGDEPPPILAAEMLQTPLRPDGEEWDNTFDPSGFWDPDPPDAFQRSKTGVKAVMHNLMLILRGHPAWKGVLAFDQYSELIMKVAAPPWQEGDFKPGEWSEVDDYRLRHWLSTWYFEAKEKDVMQAVTLVARENAFHPLIERIEAVKWDESMRLRTWLMDYLGACKGKAFEKLPIEEQDRVRLYVEKAGLKWMVGAVGRVYEAAKPGAITGSQMDTMLILEGEQGLMKSSALRVLGGEWFTDEKLDFGNKDSFLILQGRWIIEMAELEGLNKADTSATKHFITKREDLFRAPYGRKLEKKPRRCAFAGTVNHDAYLKDDSGNRRFWPITCTAIDIERLRADVDQLWAEALHWYREGVKWWVEPDERELFRIEQDKRFQEDAWQEPIEDYLYNKTRVTIAELLEHALKLEKARWDKMSQMRAGSILKRLGWLRRRMMVSGRQAWVYVHPAAEETATTISRGDDDAPF